MMLTNDTASFMGVEDRSSPRQSISGGAAYYKMIVDNLATVPEPDRTWMALAAYNMGPGYIDRARARAHRAHEDGNKWLVVSYQLRNMADEARRQGRVIPVGQALHYVQQVRRYYDALVLANSAGVDGRVAMNGPMRSVQ